MIEYSLMTDVSRMISKLIATVFFVGYAPVAPGTFGTFAGMVFIWLLEPSIALQLIVLIAVLIIGTITSDIAEKAFGQKDCRHIVIDEFAGYLCSVIFLPLTPGYMISAFFLFRAFDILKPPPIRALERIEGGTGIMLDDVAAGLITNALLQIYRFL